MVVRQGTKQFLLLKPLHSDIETEARYVQGLITGWLADNPKKEITGLAPFVYNGETRCLLVSWKEKCSTQTNTVDPDEPTLERRSR